MNFVYRGLSSDSSYNDHLLEFDSDTTLEIRTFPRHMSKGFWITIKYFKDGQKIKTFNNNLSHNDSLELTGNGFRQFLNHITLIKDGSFLIDEEHKILYASNKKFEKKYFITYIINGKRYKQEASTPDAYGLLKNNLKENKNLNDTLALLKDKIENYSVAVYKGLDAYKKFRQKYIYGVIVIKPKE
jgi:hypothetical protein